MKFKMSYGKKEEAAKSESLMQLVVPYLLAGTGTKPQARLITEPKSGVNAISDVAS